MEWTNEKVMRFLQLYQSHPCIWDPKNSAHKNRRKVYNAWVEIQHDMGERCTIKDLKKKRESLMSAFRGYRTKIRKSEMSGDPTLKYHPVWFAYEFMNSFLGDIYKGNPILKTEDSHQELENSQLSEDSAENTTVEIDSLDNEEYVSVSHLAQSASADPDFESMKDMRITSKRKQRNPLELQHVKKHRGQEYRIVRKSVRPQRVEDECSIFGKLVAAKIRKLAVDRRDLMMIKINQLFYDESQEQNGRDSPALSECYFNTSSP